MRRSPHIIVSKFLISFFISGSSVLGTSISLADNLVNMQEPLRMDDLDDYGLFSNPGSEIPYPLIYPAEISIFNLLDSANPTFQSLEDLGKLPVRNKFEQIKNGRIDYTRKSFKAKPSNPTAFGENNDPVVKFIKSSPEHSLPTDDELQTFLKNGVKNNSKVTNANELNAGNSSSDKTFAEFRNEAESSIISQIFKRSSQKSKPSQTKKELVTSVPTPPVQSSLAPPSSNPPKSEARPSASTLKFKAHKPNHNGKLEPAQASEFYLTTQNLNDLLQNMDAGPAVAGELKSVAELWAKAEKNASQAPEVALGVKSILLQAKVSKARTDPYGEASLRGVQPDEKYYLIGIDKDVLSNVVTIWSKEVEVQPGENMVELSSSDVIYQE
jgi:hypothetical protein